MQIKLTQGNRGPVGAMFPVILKIRSAGNSIWYLVPMAVGNYHQDDSYISRDDEIIYHHPDAPSKLFHYYDKMYPEYNWIPSGECEEFPINYTNNKQASNLLGKEY